MLKLRTKKAAMLKMTLIAPLAFILCLAISITISEKGFAQDQTKNKELNLDNDEKTIKEDSIFKALDPMPGFPGGDEARVKFLVKNMKYPEKARKAGIHGTVYITYVIEKNGEISNVKLLRGIGGGCDEEAMRVVSIMPPWDPGLYNGKPVRVEFTMPFTYKLDNGAKKKDNDEHKKPPPPYKK